MNVEPSPNPSVLFDHFICDLILEHVGLRE